jgi:predicted site-specific integrase-resolvase
LLRLREIETDLTVAYARVSSRDQKEDLKRQVERLELYCAAKGWSYEVIQDLGSGMNPRSRRNGYKMSWRSSRCFPPGCTGRGLIRIVNW